MKKFKLVSVFIAFALLLSLGSVFAIDEAVITEAVTDLNELKIMVGDENGDFRGDANITRAEFATIICRVLGQEGQAKYLQDKPGYFADTIGHWANGYINVAHQYEIINGFEDYTFRPDENVTVAQAIKMLVCTLGYEDDDVFKRGFPEGYIKKGEAINLYAGVTSYPEALVQNNTFATRNYIAALVHNALDINLRVQTSWSADGNHTFDTVEETIRTKYLSD
ncbi:MAG: S-layer homology domain-containing protein [Clostridia bacterium]|nr:S-layer homology domain-containing protein [Clostridia bacterium]